MRNTLLLVLLSVAAQAQSPWRLQLLDSAGFTPTAMGTVEILVAVASQPDGSPLFPPTGDLRLRIHPIEAQTGNILAPTVSLQFPGKFVVNHIAGMGNMAIARFLMTGGFQDTCFLPNDTLIGFEPLSLDPFLMRVNAHTGQPEWVWSRSQAQNNFIHKIHYDEVQNTILASGLYDDVSGWVAAFDPVNGQLLWEKAWPGARTVSDARYDPEHAGAILFTGTISDFGQLNNIPTPLTPLPNTGYRTFLARYWPANDSVQFIATTPYTTFDFEPALLLSTPILTITANPMTSFWVWSTPTVQHNRLDRRIFEHLSPTTFNQHFIEHQQWHGNFANEESWNYGPVYFFERVSTIPNQHEVAWGPVSGDRLSLQPGSAVGGAGILRSYGIPYITVKSTGSIFINSSRDTTLQVPGASPTTPRWVVLYSLMSLVNVAEPQALAFKVYPNPVAGRELFVQLEQNLAATAHWQMHDLHGRALASGSLAADDNRIPLPQLSTGMYLLELKQGDKRGWSRVVVQ